VIGEKTKEDKLFDYLRPEELIPEDHILRLIERYVDFSFVRPKVEHLYSHTGRPSVDPDVMMRMLLVGYLFGITSERRLVHGWKRPMFLVVDGHPAHTARLVLQKDPAARCRRWNDPPCGIPLPTVPGRKLRSKEAAPRRQTGTTKNPIQISSPHSA
jgi:hypothetical protein